MKAVYKITIGLFLAGAEMLMRLITELFHCFGQNLVLGKAYKGIVMTDGLGSFGWSTIANGLSGDFMGIEAVATAVGLLLVAWGTYELRTYHKRFSMAGALAVLSAVSYVAYKLAPFVFANQLKLQVYALVIFIALWIFFESAMLFSLTKAMGKQVDAYLYMELEQDLQFGFEVYFMGNVVTYLVSVFRKVDLIRFFFMAGCLACVGACWYVGMRMYHYTKKLKLFS
jgi:hypothetical protein